MGLEEEAVRAALLGMTDLPAGVAGPSLPTPQDLVNQGRLTSFSAGGATGYDYPMSGPNGGLPVGATSDSSAPLGYTIADPTLRDAASNANAGLARAVAQQQYLDAYARDRQRNTESILKSAHGLDPDLQALVMERLGLRVPGAGSPGAYGLNGLDGVMSSRLRQVLLPKILENQLNAPNKQMDQFVKMLQAQAALQNAGANADYRANLTQRGNQAQQIAIVGKLKELMAARQAAMQPGPARDLNRANMLGEMIDFIGNNFLGDMTGGGNEGAQTTDTSGGSNWWDQFMPSSVPAIAPPATGAPTGGRGAAMMRNPPRAIRPKVTRID